MGTDKELTEAERTLIPSSVDHEHLQANLRNIRAALNGEQARVKFIREAAIELYTLAWGVGRIDQDQEGMAWSAARALWDAKPEDC